MFHKILHSVRSAAQPAPVAPVKPALELGSAALSRSFVFGNHLYRTAGEDSTVYYTDESRGIRKMLVDHIGNIQDFPGIHKEDFWLRRVSGNFLKPQIRFRTDFVILDGQFAMLWQVQPDGLYWGDSDGFGVGSDEEVILYALLDEKGCWDGPFRLYSINGKEHTR